MVDWKATNLKLKQISRNIIRKIELAVSRLTDEKLDGLITFCGGIVKLVLMTLKTRLLRMKCEKRLERVEGILLQALHRMEVEKADSDVKVTDRAALTVHKK